MTGPWLVPVVMLWGWDLYRRRGGLGVGIVLLSGYLLSRGLALGRLPLLGVHDTICFFALATAAFLWIIRLKAPLAGGGDGFVLGSALLMVLIALFGRRVDTPLPPVLNTYWFELHVALSFASYALWTVSAGAGIGVLRGAPSAQEVLQYKLTFVGYSLFSLSMVFGGIWAHLAWGTYWLWTPKELWTTLLWLVYTLYLHGRLVRNWSGRPVVWLGIGGFCVMLFTYLGVGLLMKSSHSFG